MVPVTIIRYACTGVTGVTMCHIRKIWCYFVKPIYPPNLFCQLIILLVWFTLFNNKLSGCKNCVVCFTLNTGQIAHSYISVTFFMGVSQKENVFGLTIYCWENFGWLIMDDLGDKLLGEFRPHLRDKLLENFLECTNWARPVREGGREARSRRVIEKLREVDKLRPIS